MDPNQPVGCYGKEASDRNRTLVEGKTVSLEKDVSETDRFGRLLRYVYLPSGEMVNEMLVVEGYAQASSFPPDIKHQERFNAAQVQARNSARGLWGPACAPTATPVPPTSAPPPPAPTQAPPPTMAPAPGGNCHPSYPTICLPPGRDVDCGEIPQYRNFTVLPPDPYRLDGNDNDGIGCETS